ncbi:hypothetical protein P153DRAFT_362400 [Dothidotthia symphoricarpi CBS 119687]|uniref:Oxidoreductase-like protein n=1 Tax=Dothidotthia symphoricarpi CBS 119687 TaxID=1392245 RepID=A0A6A6AUN9_9PLEO|nr:uncharacterized protein P153DRAFT_362400 [Dothidotthia symphoricarpi CBS 119687]KAF2134654.1 hypothetical protein P153DRAFT_362400 [Dothidotthia symphoricarpi CBS 119687]
MSSQVIEARSLQSLTALASNPPAYPRNPTHVKHEPLVLYIARVPGSKDVFLTPMKPREKVVTAEDITSSLYFVHVEQPEDAQLVNSSEFQNRDYSEDTPAVQRKAVPTAAAPMRKPVPGNLTPINNFENRQNVNAGNYAQRPRNLGPEYTPRYSSDGPQYGSENERRTSSTARRPEHPHPVGTTLTLIRRDPGSGAQWNVARIEDPPVIEISSTGLNDSAAKRRIGAPLYIDVFNPGYSKFLHSDSASRPPLLPRPSDMSVQSYQTGMTSRPQAPDSYPGGPPGSENTFRRRLWMEGSQHTNGGFGHRKKSSYDVSSERPSSRGNYGPQSESFSTGHRPSLSYSSISSADQRNGSAMQAADRHSFFRGYVFTSPWNGRCEFVTGVGGGSLKCRHIVPGLQGAPPFAMPVSELRFNLPSSQKTPIPSPRAEEPSKRSSFFHRGRHSRNNSSISVNRPDTVDDTRNSLDRLDLSLGQEYAGGGMGGKHAKLGKLIVEDEGLKMMDLLVAANLALWWRAYEKTGSG